MTFAPPGIRYDRLARTPAHRWWRHAAALAAVLFGWLVLALMVYGVPAGLATVAGRP